MNDDTGIAMMMVMKPSYDDYANARNNDNSGS